ncbi:hypothetical protein MA16_Dca027742 [Dendrobium catenatum]|uniref:Uncharacterized protein n=2 Tax=Dendrobium catenatum TaxID=906689 RepID=A0A2I0VC11_9ASPA|nr:hypothetical protein MA16_Dca027742 [Dendrobium catenatum]
MSLKVVYDWKPVRCEGCGSLCHSFSLCPKNPAPKPSIPQKLVFRGRSTSRNPNSRTVSSSRPKVVSIPPHTVVAQSTDIPSSSKPSPTVLAQPHPPSSEPPPTQIFVQRSSSKLPTSLAQEDNILIPNLNLPQADSFSANSIPSKNILLPSQVLLVNSFQSLPVENSVNAEDDPTEEVSFDEDLSSSSKTTDVIPNKGKSKSTSKANSPPKKAKSKSAKKAKPH